MRAGVVYAVWSGEDLCFWLKTHVVNGTAARPRFSLHAATGCEYLCAVICYLLSVICYLPRLLRPTGVTVTRRRLFYLLFIDYFTRVLGRYVTDHVTDVLEPCVERAWERVSTIRP